MNLFNMSLKNIKRMFQRGPLPNRTHGSLWFQRLAHLKVCLSVLRRSFSINAHMIIFSWITLKQDLRHKKITSFEREYNLKYSRDILVTTFIKDIEAAIVRLSQIHPQTVNNSYSEISWSRPRIILFCIEPQK